MGHKSSLQHNIFDYVRKPFFIPRQYFLLALKKSHKNMIYVF